MAELGPIPLAGEEPLGEDRLAPGESQELPAPLSFARNLHGARGSVLPLVVLMVLATGHGLAIWQGMGGLSGLTNGWPLWRDDHPLYYHSALVTRAFLRQSGTTAGYDPWFMAGYPKSVIFPASSTLPELVIWAFGGSHPELAYKLYVLISAAAIPWLVAAAARVWGLRASGTTFAVTLYLLYVWTDFPINYATFGMLPYLLAVPLSLLATGQFAVYLERGGLVRWLLAACLLSLSVLVHLTAAMLVVPAAGLAYLGALVRRGRASGFPVSRHLGVWLIPVLVLASNAFWWLPGLWLASTKGASDFAFAHSSEGVAARLARIVTAEAEMESVLLAVGLPGLVLLARQGMVRAAALGGFSLAGFFWGYLAGGFQALDFLQPGRHTYAFYTGLAVAGGLCLDAFFLKLRGGGGWGSRLDYWALAAVLLIGFRMLGAPVWDSLRLRLWVGEPFLSSRPSPRLLWVVDRVKSHVKPGERLLYEEGGKGLPGILDPFQRGRFSGLLPEQTGVELIGGPYLHAALTTNFTQFGEGALFGKTDWDRDHFQTYARIYRPAALLCWSPRARRFCQSNPDLVDVLDDDGTLLIGRIKGFKGDTISGSARVSAQDGRLRVSELSPGVDGLVVLRYHSVPNLRARPPIPLELRSEAGDPVPFIGLRPPQGTREVELEMTVPWPPH
jgi:hypothetical protein